MNYFYDILKTLIDQYWNELAAIWVEIKLGCSPMPGWIASYKNYGQWGPALITKPDSKRKKTQTLSEIGARLFISLANK